MGYIAFKESRSINRIPFLKPYSSNVTKQSYLSSTLHISRTTNYTARHIIFNITYHLPPLHTLLPPHAHAHAPFPPLFTTINSNTTHTLLSRHTPPHQSPYPHPSIPLTSQPPPRLKQVDILHYLPPMPTLLLGDGGRKGKERKGKGVGRQILESQQPLRGSTYSGCHDGARRPSINTVQTNAWLTS